MNRKESKTLHPATIGAVGLALNVLGIALLAWAGQAYADNYRIADSMSSRALDNFRLNLGCVEGAP